MIWKQTVGEGGKQGDRGGFGGASETRSLLSQWQHDEVPTDQAINRETMQLRASFHIGGSQVMSLSC